MTKSPLCFRRNSTSSPGLFRALDTRLALCSILFTLLIICKNNWLDYSGMVVLYWALHLNTSGV